jgi:hypothetical protein
MALRKREEEEAIDRTLEEFALKNAMDLTTELIN